jgi:hypothetical protein
MKRAQGKSNIDIVKGYLDGERPFIQVGYVGDKDKYIIRKEGETWTDASGKNWIQTATGPQAVTRVMDIIREEMNDKCACCGREIRWGTKQDRKMYNRTKKCLDCVAKEETDLRAKGQFKLYETKKMIENELSYLSDIKQKLRESKNYLESEESKTLTWANSTGMVEEWSNEARGELKEHIQKDWVTCLKKIKAAEKELKKVNEKIAEVLNKKS